MNHGPASPPGPASPGLSHGVPPAPASSTSGGLRGHRLQTTDALQASGPWAAVLPRSAAGGPPCRFLPPRPAPGTQLLAEWTVRPAGVGGTRGSCRLLQVGVGRQESSLLGERGAGSVWRTRPSDGGELSRLDMALVQYVHAHTRIALVQYVFTRTHMHSTG